MIKLRDDFLIHEHGYFISHSSQDGFCDPGIMKELINFFSKEGGSVLDLGCGDGRYVKGLMEAGIDAIGYDGNPYTRELTNGLCMVWDLVEIKKLQELFDWVLCLEVGEHIDNQFEHNLIQNLHLNNKLGIILSWAVEGQGGTNHVNCHSNEYIIRLLEKLGYTHDIDAEQSFRNSATNCYWFKDSILVFRRKD
jgi:2-polyprenyl-3-methyl-5-hydroxy-6-metoxy-1,4-benzoquinol methylase